MTNKNVAPSEVTDNVETKEGMPFGASPSFGFYVSLDYLGGAMGIPKLRLFPLLIP